MESKTVTDYPNYTVFEDGTVVGARGKVLKYDENRTGYRRITLCKDGKVKRIFVHRLVALHFLGDPPSEDSILNHKDGNKHNNHYSNLEWTTHADNLRHAIQSGLRDMKNKVEMSDDKRHRVISMLESSRYTYNQIAEDCNVSYNTVALVNRKLRERATTIRKE